MTEQRQKKNNEEEEVRDRSAPAGSIVYKAIRKEGEEELERSSSALAWSGLAAGLSMGFSFVAEALLKRHTPEAEWQPLVVKFGYSIGFLIVVLGRQQLFTENTLTVVLPLLTEKKPKKFLNVARLWSIVLAANVAGCLLFGLVLARTQVLPAEYSAALTSIAGTAVSESFGVTFLRAIFAGWLIALMVWLLPFAESARVLVIIIITYLVGIGHFSHIIAGSTEVSYLLWGGKTSMTTALLSFFIPTLLGNIAGGVSLVAAINHAQVVAGGDGQDL